MKLLVDMNLSPRWVDRLTDAGHEAAHWSTLGRYDASDVEITAYARKHDCVVLTHDLDFSAILAATRGEKPSVIQLRADDVTPERIGSPVVAALAQLTSQLAEGALVTIEPDRTRVRVLPLRERTR